MDESQFQKFWTVQVAQSYNTLHRFVISKCVIIFVYYLIISFTNQSQNYFDLILLALSLLSLCLITVYIAGKGQTAKIIFGLLYSEAMINCLHYLSYNHYEKYSILLQHLATQMMGFFEMCFLPSIILHNVALFKHLLLVFYINYYTGQLEFDEDMMPHLLAFMFLVTFNFIILFKGGIEIANFNNKEETLKIQSRLEAILSSITCGILIMDQNLDILYCNPNGLTLLNCEESQLKEFMMREQYYEGKKFSNLSQSNYVIDDLRKMLEIDVNSERNLGISINNHNKIEWKSKKIIWEDHQALSIVLTNANSIIDLEQSLSDNKLKNVLLRSVSHELRTPINAISFLTQDLLENSSLSDETHEKLKIVNVSSQLLLNLVNDLLDYSRMLAGVFAINKCFFNIKDALENAIELIKLQAKKKNITLMLRIDPELNLLIYSDPFRLSQVLLNLLSNALKFTLKGSIEVICLSSCNQTLKIIIQDSGIGINSSKLEMLFEEFNTQNINMLNPQGAGLGLNISNKIVQKLGGTPINVDSSIGQGSEFSFVLDIAEDVVITEILYDDSYNSCTSENTTTDLSSLSRAILFKQDAKVLIVDDNDFNRAILVSILQKNNISYIEAYNGLEALNEVTNRKHNFKVIIMDGEMPVMDGWEASRKIHDFFADDVTSKAPVIIGYTAYTSVEDVNKFYLCKVSECVIKPCSPQKMLDTINKYL